MCVLDDSWLLLGATWLIQTRAGQFTRWILARRVSHRHCESLPATPLDRLWVDDRIGSQQIPANTSEQGFGQETWGRGGAGGWMDSFFNYSQRISVLHAHDGWS